MKNLIFAVVGLLLTTSLMSQQEKDLGIHVFQYKIDSIWLGTGPVDTPMYRLLQKGDAVSYKVAKATIELQLSEDGAFVDRLIIIDPLFKIRDTLFIEVQNTLKNKELITLFMWGWSKIKDKLSGKDHDYMVEYRIGLKPNFLFYRVDNPKQRVAYFIRIQSLFVLPPQSKNI